MVPGTNCYLVISVQHDEMVPQRNLQVMIVAPIARRSWTQSGRRGMPESMSGQAASKCFFPSHQLVFWLM